MTEWRARLRGLREDARRWLAVHPRNPQFAEEDRLLFLRRLSMFLRGGMPITEALAVMREPGTRGDSVIQEVSESLRNGAPLSSALRRIPSSFSGFVLTLIEMGEESGTLSESLALAANAMAERQALRNKVLGALLYPAIIILSTLGVCLFLVAYAFPKIVPLFRGFRIALPFPTRVLIGVTDVISRYGWLIAGSLVILAACGSLLFRLETVRTWWDAFILRVPVAGGLMRSYHLAEIARATATLTEAGMPLVPALRKVTAGVTNRSYASSLERVAARAVAGGRLASALREERICFPPLFVHMTASGELTGDMGEAFRMLASSYEEELAERSERLVRLIEPILMIGMGLAVGFIALAIITPMYRLTQDIPLS